ncbi:hypothetical protein OEZ86_005718 [Tetradesmus obliquus]|nr:hypothetical protein OEZ86_005718 [Tetradesmus obliquus]
MQAVQRAGVACAWKALQVFVGCMFFVILNTLWAIASVHRIFVKPAALKRCRPSSLAATAAAAASAVPASGTGTGLKQAADKQNGGPIIIRAVATSTAAVKPIMVHNDSAKGHDSLAWKLVGPYMKLYGRNAIANSQLFNPEFIHFYVPGMGSLPYIVADIYSRVIVSVIGDPLAHRSNWRTISEMFVKEFPGTYFYHASKEYAQVLHDIGYYINDVGAETTLQVQQWTYSSKTRTVRAAARAARESGVRIRELQPHEFDDEMRRKLQYEVSEDWLQKKAVAERVLRVFVRNVDYENMQLANGVRVFVAEAHHPAHAPPAVVDPVLQGLPANVKPPKPPRNKSRSSLAGAASGGLSRSNSVLTSASSIASQLSGLASLTGLASGSQPNLPAAAAAAAAGKGSSNSLSSEASLPSELTAAAAKETSTSPFAAAGAAAAAAAAASVPEEQEEPAEPAAPELVGFVLLDPLWQDNEEVGYVSSICRMKRTAHQGTLKLLYEDIISKLRSEGRRELAFGFAPFFNVRDDVFGRLVHWIRWTNLYFYHCANNLYAFQNLAFSKIRYGAGVDGDAFRDPNVKMTHIYMATKSPLPGMEVLDLYVLCMYVGFMAEMFDTLLKLVGARKGGANLGSGETCE